VTRVLSRLAALAVLAWVLGFAVFVLTLPGPAGAETTDAIVVVTGGEGRLARGLELLRQKKAKRLLVSGVDRSVRPHELAIAANAPVSLFDCCVDLGREAVDTRSNAEETAAWLKRRNYRSVRLVTSGWHMPRARLELAARIDPEVRILEDAVPGERPPGAMLREYSKFALRYAAMLLGVV